MSKIQLKDLKPGKKYKLIIEVDTEFDSINSFPAIEFTVPEAPPASKKNDLSISSEQVDETVYEDRIIINNGTLKYRPRGGTIRQIKTTGSLSTGLTVGDKITIANIVTSGYNVTNATVLSTPTVDSFTYNGTGTIISNDTYTSDTTSSLTEKNGTAKTKKVTLAVIKIPDAVINNLIWNDTVRDFVHVVFRSALDKDDLSGARYYVNSSGEELTSTPRDMNTDPDLSSAFYDYGMPKIVKKKITDAKYYEFQYITARYIKNAAGEWEGQWLEPGPNKNRLSSPVRWGQ
jgi:hypothetical protein